jgi:hypothetical protein
LIVKKEPQLDSNCIAQPRSNTKPELNMQNQIQTLEIVDTVRELSLEDIEVVSGGNGTTDFPINHRG